MEAKAIWKNVRAEIKRNKTTQKKLVTHLEGISYENLQQQIHHDRLPDAVEIFQIARALNTTVEFLITGKDIGEFSREERTVIEKYKILSDSNKNSVRLLIDSMLPVPQGGEAIQSNQEKAS
ncbi:MAG: hypothetical protein FWC03_11750 [Treponema sp.]|nr:hypothetical protein [Treponema sp.]MCL2245118.1 hypothetical protein [Treponema sp.]